MESVYFAVGAEPLHVVYVKFSLHIYVILLRVTLLKPDINVRCLNY